VTRVVDETDGSKGRATPSRKEAEAARKKQMKVPLSRKEQAKRERASRESMRVKQREALKSGDEKYLPARDRGPARRFARDYVDRRRNVAEYLLLFLVVVLVLSFIASGADQAWAASGTVLIYPLILVAVMIDEYVMVRGLRRGLAARFGSDDTRGAVGYAVLRTMQLRRMRLPKPQIGHGEALRAKY
jgi:hypothetical protein